MEKIEIVTEIAALDGGKWIYAPKAETPHRFWLDNDSYISHAQDFIEWDGIKDIPIGWDFCHFKDYTESYDAILPVIKKLKDEKHWSSNPGDYPTWMFSGELCKILGLKLWDNGTPLKSPRNLCQIILSATPFQLCEAVLKAVNKWKE